MVGVARFHHRGRLNVVAAPPSIEERRGELLYGATMLRHVQYATHVGAVLAVTPNLTLETYAEPFAASGRFYDYGELSAPRERDLRKYGTYGTTITAPDSLGRAA